MGNAHTEADHAVFTHFWDSKITIIALYVNDFTMACEDLKVIKCNKKKLKKHYQMMDLGEISYILSIHVTRDHKAGHISLSQQKYIEEILEHFGKTNVCPITTPVLTNEHLTRR